MTRAPPTPNPRGRAHTPPRTHRDKARKLIKLAGPPWRPVLCAHRATPNIFARSTFPVTSALRHQRGPRTSADRSNRKPNHPPRRASDPARRARCRVLHTIPSLWRRLVSSKDTGPLTRKHRQPGHVQLVFVRRFVTHGAGCICVGSW